MREADKVCVHSDVSLLKERWAERQRLTAERNKLIAELEAVLEPELGTQAMRKATGLVMERMADRTARRVSLVHAHQVTPAAMHRLRSAHFCVACATADVPLRYAHRSTLCPSEAASRGCRHADEGSSSLQLEAIVPVPNPIALASQDSVVSFSATREYTELPCGSSQLASMVPQAALISDAEE